jgi:hypothetical protein
MMGQKSSSSSSSNLGNRSNNHPTEEITQRMASQSDEDFPLSQRKVIASLIWRGKEYELFEGENFIGRDQVCEVAIDHKSVSSKHAEIIIRNNLVTIRDLRSVNGTYVEIPTNSNIYFKLNAVDNLRSLENGCRVRFGMVCCEFVFHNGENHGPVNNNYETQFLDPRVVLGSSSSGKISRGVMDNDKIIDPLTAHHNDEDNGIDEDDMEDIESDTTEIGNDTEEQEWHTAEQEQVEGKKMIAKSSLEAHKPFLHTPATTSVALKTPTAPIMQKEAFRKRRNPVLDSDTLVDHSLEPFIEEEGEEEEENYDDNASTISQDLMEPIPEGEEAAVAEEEKLKTHQQTPAKSTVTESELVPTSTSSSLKLSGTANTPAKTATPSSATRGRKGKAAIEATPIIPLSTPPSAASSKKRGRKSLLDEDDTQDSSHIIETDTKTGEKATSKPDLQFPTVTPVTSAKKRGRKALLDEELAETEEQRPSPGQVFPFGALTVPLQQEKQTDFDHERMLENTPSPDNQNQRKKKRLSFNLASLNEAMQVKEPEEVEPTSSAYAKNNGKPEDPLEKENVEGKPASPVKKAKGRGGRIKKEPIEKAVNAEVPSEGEVAPVIKTSQRGRKKAGIEPEVKGEKSSIRSSHHRTVPIRIMFTKLEEQSYSKQLKKLVSNGSIEITSDPTIATYVITTKELKRTPKLLIGLNSVVHYVINDSWIMDSFKAGRPLPVIDEERDEEENQENYERYLTGSKYLIKDEEKEILWNFHLISTLSEIHFSTHFETKSSSSSSSASASSAIMLHRNEDQKVFHGYSFFITAGVCGVTAPLEEDMIQIVQSGGGTWLTTITEYTIGLTGKEKKLLATVGKKRPKEIHEDQYEGSGTTFLSSVLQKPLIVISHSTVVKKELNEEIISLIRKSGLNRVYSIEVILKSVMKQKMCLSEDYLEGLQFT